MAIAKMKQMTLLAEQSNKDRLLKAVQELQRLELVDLSTLEESELFDYYIRETDNTKGNEYETRLKEVQTTLSYLQQYIPQPGMLEKLKKGRDEYTLEELESRVESADIEQTIEEIQQLERTLVHLDQKLKDLAEEESFLRKWQNLDFNPKELESFQLMPGTVGTVISGNALEFREALNAAGTNYVEEIFQNRDEAAYLILAPADEYSATQGVLTQFQFTKLRYGNEQLPKEELKRNLQQRKEVQNKEENVKKELRSYKKQVNNLELAEEYYHNLVQREVGKSLLLNGNSLFILNGWLEEEQVPQLTALMDEYVGKESYAIVANEIKMKDYDTVPVVLKNNKFVKPFESLTEMYSFPKYNDIDPTPFMMPFYLVFFGMMSADIGYGVLLLIGTLLASKFFKLDRGMAGFMRFFHLLSYSVIVWGIIFGTFFGYELPFQPLSTTDDVITILVLSVVFGFIQLVYGLVINGAVKWRKQQRVASYVDGYAWVGILVGVGLVVLGMMVLDMPILNTVGYVLIGINVLGIILITMLSSENKGLGAALGFYNIYGVTGYIGDLVSYTRLMALGVSSGSIAAAFNLIVEFLPPAVRFTLGIVLFLALHSLNIFLSYLSAYVHTARLQYVEFFGKFYEGGGRSLAPLKTLEKHIYLKKKQ